MMPCRDFHKLNILTTMIEERVKGSASYRTAAGKMIGVADDLARFDHADFGEVLSWAKTFHTMQQSVADRHALSIWPRICRCKPANKYAATFKPPLTVSLHQQAQQQGAMPAFKLTSEKQVCWCCPLPTLLTREPNSSCTVMTWSMIS